MSHSRRFEVERLGTYDFSCIIEEILTLSTAPDEIEYEDLNYYYANYSRQVNLPHSCNDLLISQTAYIMT